MFIIEYTRTAPDAQVEAHLESHRDWIKPLAAAGKFLMWGPKAPKNGGIIVADFESLEALEQDIQNDPFYQHGLAEIKITEFTNMA